MSVIVSGDEEWDASLSTGATGDPSEPTGSILKLAVTSWTLNLINRSQKTVHPGGKTYDHHNGEVMLTTVVKAIVLTTVGANLGAEANAVIEFAYQCQKLHAADIYFICEVEGTNLEYRDNEDDLNDYFIVSLDQVTFQAEAGEKFITATINMTRTG